jgi:release factor glutamine methyltransferase
MTGHPAISDYPQTVFNLVKQGARYLGEHGVPNAPRNAQWLLAHALACRSADLYLDPVRIPADSQVSLFRTLVARRASREPLQYVLGCTEFMSLPFHTVPPVFIPRPDTEVLVERVEERLLWKATAPEKPRILDLCCGSGVIGVSLASRLARATVVAVDVDEAAVRLTEKNAALNGVANRLQVVQADALRFMAAGEGKFDAIVSNPPYVPTDDIDSLPPEIRCHESVLGLDGGRDGMDFYRAAAPLVVGRLAPGGIVAFEIAEFQGSDVTGLLADAGLRDGEVCRDYGGLDRVVIARVPAGCGEESGDG